MQSNRIENIVKNADKFCNNLDSLVDSIYYFCHSSFPVPAGKEHGQLKDVPGFDKVLKAMSHLMLDEAYSPQIFSIVDKRGRPFWLNGCRDFINKHPKTPYFFRCHYYRDPSQLSLLNTDDVELKPDGNNWEIIEKLLRENNTLRIENNKLREGGRP